MWIPIWTSHRFSTEMGDQVFFVIVILGMASLPLAKWTSFFIRRPGCMALGTKVMNPTRTFHAELVIDH